MFSVLLLIGLHTSIGVERTLTCIDVDNLEKEERKNFPPYPLPEDILLSKGYYETEIHKASNYFTGQNNQIIFSTRFNLKDEITKDNFNFQVELLNLISKSKTFPFDLHCFTQKEEGYLITVRRPGYTSFSNVMQGIKLSVLKEYLLKLLKLFVKLENKGAVLMSANTLNFVVPLKGEKKIFVRSIASACKDGSLCYVPRTYARDQIDRNYLFNMDFFKKAEYTLEIADKKQNCKNFISLVKGYIRYYISMQALRRSEYFIFLLKRKNSLFRDGLCANAPHEHIWMRVRSLIKNLDQLKISGNNKEAESESSTDEAEHLYSSLSSYDSSPKESRSVFSIFDNK